MTSARPYHAPLAPTRRWRSAGAQAGTQFAPWAVDALERLVDAGAIDGKAAASTPAAAPSPAAEPGKGSFAAACRHALDELRAAMGWEQAVLTRISHEVIEVVAVSGADIVHPGQRAPVEDALCHQMLAGVAAPAHGRASDPDSGYADVRLRRELGIESYSGHAVRLPDGSLFGTLCVLDRAPRDISAPGRALGEALAKLIAWEAGRERVATALGRARAGLAGD